MKAGKYTLKQIFEDREVERIVIPEIQRDYVWSHSHVTGLLDSILQKYQEYQTLKGRTLEELFTPNADDNIIRAYKEGLLRQKGTINVGFIYAYFDPTYYGQFFLIDGQQRFTTLYLLMLNLAVKSGKNDLFLKIYCAKGEPKLAYKVREASHTFLHNFVRFALKSSPSFTAEEIKEQPWYMADYDADQTIQTVLANYSLINQRISTKQAGELYEYLEGYLELWYFDTNLSKQGENLYISMNARGEQLADNENIKASLLKEVGNPLEKQSWGTIWENWQDFFWQHKGENSNADKGFNEFLRCIAGLLNFKRAKSSRAIKGTLDEQGILAKDVLELITLRDLERYQTALEWIHNSKDSFVAPYLPHEVSWVNACLGDIWKLLNKESTNWFADTTDPNRGTEISRMVFVWSVLEFLASDTALGEIDKFRVLRLFYVRFHNFDRSIGNMPARVASLSNGGILGVDDTYLTQEEIAKRDYYRALGNDITDAESVVWKLEDHPLNLKGKDFVNISHLMNFSANPSINELSEIKHKFYKLFPIEKKSHHVLQTLLLHYGEYWVRVSPHYYENYQLDNWGHNIRTKPFQEFFREYHNQDLKEFLKEKNRSFLSGKTLEEIKSLSTLREQVLVYTMLIKDIWDKGRRNNIAVKSWESAALFFEKESPYFSVMRRNFRNDNWIDLYSQVKDLDNDEVAAKLFGKIKEEDAIAAVTSEL